MVNTFLRFLIIYHFVPRCVRKLAIVLAWVKKWWPFYKIRGLEKDGNFYVPSEVYSRLLCQKFFSWNWIWFNYTAHLALKELVVMPKSIRRRLKKETSFFLYRRPPEKVWLKKIVLTFSVSITTYCRHKKYHPYFKKIVIY